MEYEIINAIAEFKRLVENMLQENLEEMPYFNRKLKNIIMDRLFEILNSHKVSITNQQVEDLVDIKIFPMINEFSRDRVTKKSENYLGIAREFSQELMPNEQLLPLDDSGKENVNKAMEKFINLSTEARKTNIDFSELYQEIINLLKAENLINADNFEIKEDVISSLKRTQSQTEEYYGEKNENLTRNSESMAEQIYQMYLTLIDQKTNVNQSEINPGMSNPFN